MSYDALEEKLNNISESLKEEDESFKRLVQDISEKDDTKLSSDIFNQVFTEEEREYHKVNSAYKRYISQYSKEYIEMSEYYYGPELPYDVYCREFQKKNMKEGDTYLDSPQDVKELYSLFIFFMFFDLYTRNARHFQSSSDIVE